MNYTRLVCREYDRFGPGWTLTIDFGIGEVMARSSVSGEVRWRRLTNPLKDVLRSKLEACGFEAWDGYAVSPADMDRRPDVREKTDGHAWGVFFYADGESVGMVSACDAVLSKRPAFASLMDLCLSLAEDRSKREESA